MGTNRHPEAGIVLATLNAKYIHTAFGPRYLMANLGPLQKRAVLIEFDSQQRASDIVEALPAAGKSHCRAARI